MEDNAWPVESDDKYTFTIHIMHVINKIQIYVKMIK